MKNLALLFSAVSVAMLSFGCTMTSSDEKNSGNAQAQMQQCNAENLRTLTGQKLTEALTDKIRVQSSSGTVRVIKPNQAVTMDFNATRVNVHLDENDAITIITCG